VRPGAKVKLKEWPTKVKPFCKSKKRYKKLLEEHVEELSALQQLHYASNRYALLLIFQGMDAGGKDGAIRHVMSGVNPQGCEVFSFKQPTADELEHDFLWRTNRHLPERGRSASSIVPITRKCWSSGCIQKFSAVRGCRKSCATKKTSGRSGISPSWIWTASPPQRHASSNFSCTCRKTNSENDSSNALMSRTRTGNSASRTFTSGNTGSIT
jgi:hypothetical protein